MNIHWPTPSDFPPLTGNDVHVWAVPLELRSPAPRECLSVLTDGDRERAESFAFDPPRETFLLSRAALRTLLGRYLDLSPQSVPIEIDQFGKPQLDDAELRFNVAHSGQLTLIALTRGCEIGVDLERLRPVERSRAIATRYFHPREQSAIRSARDAELPATFLQLWTRKEALLKAVGVGLGHPLDAFETGTVAGAGSWVELPAIAAHPAMRCWLQDVTPHPDYLAAVATGEYRGPPMGYTYSL